MSPVIGQGLEIGLLAQVHNEVLSSAELSAAILDSAGAIVDVSDSWMHFARENGGALDTVGVGVNYLDVCRRSAATSPDAASALAGLTAVISGVSRSFRLVYRCDAPGVRRFFTMRVKPLPPGRAGVIVTHQNSTEMQSAEALYGDLLDSVRAIIWRAALPHFRTTYVSKQAEEILGYPADRWTTIPDWWIQRMHPEDREWVLTLSSEAVQELRNHSFEYRMVAADDRIVWLRNIVNVIVEDGQPRAVVGVSVDITERKNAEQVREQLAGRLLAAQEEERRSIARELHDDIGQSVMFLNMTLDAIRQRVREPELGAEIADLAKLAQNVVRDVERVSQGLHPASLEFLGLGAAVRQLCGEFRDRYGATIECQVGNVPDDLGPAIVATLYRVSQECLRNIAKHSRASHVTVELSASPKEMRLCIRDDGVGFDVGRARTARGLGLASMHERIRLARGTLDIVSSPGQGARIEAKIPLA